MMSKRAKIVVGLVICLIGLAVVLYFGTTYQLKRWYLEEDPILWLPEIRAFEASDRQQGVRKNAIVFVGSSSIRFWESLAADMAPLPVIKRGFGGARLADVTHYVDRIVAPYEPAAVVLFAGTNDIVPGRSKTPADMLARYKAFVDRVWALLPGTPIFYIAITPSPSRWSVWPVAQESNRLIREFSDSHINLHVIDTSSKLLGADGQPKVEMYRADGLHLSAAGYRAWTASVRPSLLQWMAEHQYTQQSKSGG
ncbi:GDSL-type esterase/lipase family protein [Litorivivens sp.]|uniref:GDSL-type esterase/lipase family protein n=2 Tax=Litorivivens sp. TaxID=2020868 RepID=UPI0035626A21